MDKTLLKSKFSFRYIYKVIIFFVFVNIFILSFSTKQAKWYLEEYYFDFETFFIANGILLPFCGLLILFLSIDRLVIIITDNKVIVENYVSKKKVEFLFSEITGLEWKNINNSVDFNNGPSVSINNQYISVLFEDESILFISKYEYRNYEELQGFFYDYCINNNLIKTPTSRYKHQLRRKWLNKKAN